MTESYQSLTHSRWDCKYHVVFIPKRRRKARFGNIRKQLGAIFHELARQKECHIIEGHLLPDHVHMCIAIPPKHSVASVVGFIKGKRNRHCTTVQRSSAQLHGRELLGAWLLRLDCRLRRREGPRLHS